VQIKNVLYKTLIKRLQSKFH